MADRLVTIATFGQPAKARLAQNALQAAGIRAAVSDEAVVAMDWLLSNAVGGVKVQVREEDAERAVGELEQAFGVNGEGLGPAEAVDPAELAAEAEATPPEPDDPPAEASGPSPASAASLPADAHDGPDDTLMAREQDARRAFHAALFGLVVPLLLFYALYLVMTTWFDDGNLRPRARRWLWWATGMTGFGIVAWWGWTFYYPGDFLEIY